MFSKLHPVTRLTPLAIIVVCVLAGTVSAQTPVPPVGGQSGGGRDFGGGIGQGGIGQGGGDGQTALGDNAATGLNADEAFSNVQRGNTVGSTAETGAGFSDVGANAAGGGATGVGGLGGLGGFGGFGGGFGGFGNAFGGQFGGIGSDRPIIRTRIRSAVVLAPTAVSGLRASAATRLSRIPTRTRLSAIRVTMQGSTAVLDGQSITEPDRRMGQLLMNLEPGVRRVENRINLQAR